MHKLNLLITCTFVSILSHAQIKVPKVKIPTTKSSVIPSASQLTESDIANGLKEALTIGAQKAAQQLNQMDGFYKNLEVKIPFPEEATRVATELRKIGMGKKVDEFELTLNRAAEDAAKEAAPIFVNAIKSMSISDAKNILTGPDTAATGFLRKTTYNSLFSAFSPHISTALANNYATSKWTEITTIYNRLPLVKKVDTDLVHYTTGKALKGAFILVAKEEEKIRKDPAARVSDLLKKVFGSKG